MKQHRDTLVLITGEPPGKSLTEEVFLAPELPVLARRFGKVVRMSLQDQFGKGKRLAASFDRVAIGATVRARGEHSSLLRANSFGARAAMWRDRFASMIAEGEIDPQRTLFYTFWFDSATAGLALLCDNYPLCIVSRAHGYDIREERSRWLRDVMLRNITALYPACESSTRLLSRQWPEYSHKISTMRLGSMPPGEPNRPADARGPVRLVSSARIVDIKRVDMVAKVVTAFARRAYPRQVEWAHFGDGPDDQKTKVCRIIREANCDNLKVDMHGAVKNTAIRRSYSDSGYHWTLLMSRDEGGVPITLCESMSFGVPVVASGVGGVGEILADGVNGIMADGDEVCPEQVAERMFSVMSTTSVYRDMSVAARRTWAERFDAVKLRHEFVEMIGRL